MNPKILSLRAIEKLAISVLVLPFVVWTILIMSMKIKRQFPPSIATKHSLHVETFLSGARHRDAGVQEIVRRTTDDGLWVGQKSKITLDPTTGGLIFECSLFEAPARLSYDGFKWSGFTTKSGRGMPIAVIAWPDF